MEHTRESLRALWERIKHTTSPGTYGHTTAEESAAADIAHEGPNRPLALSIAAARNLAGTHFNQPSHGPRHVYDILMAVDAREHPGEDERTRIRRHLDALQNVDRSALTPYQLSRLDSSVDSLCEQLQALEWDQLSERERAEARAHAEDGPDDAGGF